MRRVLGMLACVVASTCKPIGTEKGGLVVVKLPPGLASVCVRVQLTPEGGQVVKSDGQAVTGRTQVAVAVVQKDFPDSMSVRAIGYSDAACTVLTDPAELSEAATLTFESPPSTVTVTLSASTPVVDADGDGSPVTEDCNDTDKAIYPSAIETCSDAKDNNCNGSTDCSDATCASRACVAGVSESRAACVSGRCEERNCNNGVDDDQDNLIDCDDQSCDGRECASGGTCMNLHCVNATNETSCSDGIDNDNDGQTDCGDRADCDAKSCSDGKSCTVTEMCSNGTCQGGVESCRNTTNSCRVDAGACGPTGACVFAALPAAVACSDGLNCTTADSCDGDGGCAGMPVSCAPPADVCHAPGRCQESDGGCVYDVIVDAGCDDTNACTVNDVCQPSGQCSGSMRQCPAPNECQVSGGCVADAGCILTPRTGETCDGGVCLANGTCAPLLNPSNVTLAQVLAGADAGTWSLTNNCLLRIDTGDAGGPPVFSSSGCGPQTPAWSLVPQANGPELVVISVNAISITSNATLQAFGSRPLVLTAAQDITVSGTVNVGPLAVQGVWRDGAAGNLDAFCGAGGRGGSMGNTDHAGGGGGAFGSAGGAGGNGPTSLTGVTGAPGGVSAGTATLIPLRGGCAGGAGGSWTGEVNTGLAGGAVQLVALGTLTLGGTVAAPGGGGAGTLNGHHGGGGGGSGGALLLEGGTITVLASARITSQGGGGGAGSGGSGNREGLPGEPGATNSTTPAAGGSPQGGTPAGEGGTGATLTAAATDGGASTSATFGGGGGGGGGVGRIRLNALNGCTISPQAVVSPAATGSGAGCQ